MSRNAAAMPALRRALDEALWGRSPSLSRLLSIYRYASVILTGVYYLASRPAAWAGYKCIVAAALAVSAVIVNTMLNMKSRDTSHVTLAITIETLGISLLLAPTGGIDSPYLWYALNPVLISACFLRPHISWILLGFYSFAAALISTAVFMAEYPDIFSVFERRGVYFLVFILAALSMQLMARLIRKKTEDQMALEQQKEKLNAANAKLELVNGKLRESVDDLLSLYQTVNDLAMETDRGAALTGLSQYAVKLSKSGFAFFISADHDGKAGQAHFHGASPAKEQIARMAGELANGAALREEPTVVSVCGCEMLVACVKSTAKLHGLLGFSIDTGGTGKASQADSGRMGFIANLFGIVLERVGAYEAENRLMIAQERNRIADEIHDSVCQRLFSITCSAHSVTSRLDGMDPQELLDQLALIEECARAANQEIRQCVYGLSSKKRNVNNLFNELEKYLQDFTKLNGIVLYVDLKGDDSALPAAMQKSLHRIVREACGNAARHGKCGSIGVRMTIQGKSVFLKIEDDGTGFTVGSDLTVAHSGGIKNMKTIAEQYGGTFELESQPQKGTSITIWIPLCHNEGVISGEAAI